MAVSPDLPDDGLNTDGKPRLIRYKRPQNEGGKKGKMDLDDLKKEVEMDDHQIPLASLCAQLGTDPNLVSARETFFFFQFPSQKRQFEPFGRL